MLLDISIHAPSRERRPMQALCPILTRYFNPRSLAGATGNQQRPLRGNINFNPRSLAGATALVAQQFYFYRYFNPRSLAGATSQRAGELIDECISIHAPSRERLTELKTINENYNFNPRSLAGATTLDDTRCLIYADFNPRSLAGATQGKSREKAD